MNEADIEAARKATVELTKKITDATLGYHPPTRLLALTTVLAATLQIHAGPNRHQLERATKQAVQSLRNMMRSPPDHEMRTLAEAARLRIRFNEAIGPIAAFVPEQTLSTILMEIAQQAENPQHANELLQDGIKLIRDFLDEPDDAKNSQTGDEP